MRKVIIALGFLLCFIGTPARSAIQPLQVKACENPLIGSGGFISSCSFDNLVTAGDLIVAAVLNACDPTLPYDHKCIDVSDNQGNAWQSAIVVEYYDGQPLLYALNAKGGQETISFNANTGRLAIIAEYPPSTGLESANAGYYGPQNAGQDCIIGEGSCDVGYTLPVETQESCELLISWGNGGELDAANFQGSPLQTLSGPYFAVRAQAYGGFLALEDSTTSIPGLYVGTIKWNYYAHWMEGVAAFKMGGCH